MDANNQYSNMQRNQYNTTAAEMAVMNHRQHNANPDYWNILLKPLQDNPAGWAGKMALDFGCGHGRNVENMLNLAPSFPRVDGCDISSQNVVYAEKYLNEKGFKDRFKLYVNNGVALDVIPDNQYDFVMSTIVLQHICVYDIRFSLLKDIFRTMKSGGIFSFQMGYGPAHPVARTYYENYYQATGTNGSYDVKILDPKEAYDDLAKIGFVNINHEIRPPFDDRHSNWIFIKATKP